MAKSQKMGSSEVVILENTFSKVTILGNTSQNNVVNRKIGQAKALVIVATENMAEIRPPGAEARNWQNLKMGIVRSDDSGEYFLKSDDSWKYISK